MQPEHGQHDDQAQKWFCGYWMTVEEWEDMHDYAPFVKTEQQQQQQQQLREAEQTDEEEND